MVSFGTAVVGVWISFLFSLFTFSTLLKLKKKFSPVQSVH